MRKIVNQLEVCTTALINRIETDRSWYRPGGKIVVSTIENNHAKTAR